MTNDELMLKLANAIFDLYKIQNELVLRNAAENKITRDGEEKLKADAWKANALSNTVQEEQERAMGQLTIGYF